MNSFWDDVTNQDAEDQEPEDDSGQPSVPIPEASDYESTGVLVNFEGEITLNGIPAFNDNIFPISNSDSSGIDCPTATRTLTLWSQTGNTPGLVQYDITGAGPFNASTTITPMYYAPSIGGYGDSESERYNPAILARSGAAYTFGTFLIYGRTISQVSFGSPGDPGDDPTPARISDVRYYLPDDEINLKSIAVAEIGGRIGGTTAQSLVFFLENAEVPTQIKAYPVPFGIEDTCRRIDIRNALPEGFNNRMRLLILRKNTIDSDREGDDDNIIWVVGLNSNRTQARLSAYSLADTVSYGDSLDSNDFTYTAPSGKTIAGVTLVDGHFFFIHDETPNATAQRVQYIEGDAGPATTITVDSCLSPNDGRDMDHPIVRSLSFDVTVGFAYPPGFPPTIGIDEFKTDDVAISLNFPGITSPTRVSPTLTTDAAMAEVLGRRFSIELARAPGELRGGLGTIRIEVRYEAIPELTNPQGVVIAGPSQFASRTLYFLLQAAASIPSFGRATLCQSTITFQVTWSAPIPTSNFNANNIEITSDNTSIGSNLTKSVTPTTSTNGMTTTYDVSVGINTIGTNFQLFAAIDADVVPETNAREGTARYPAGSGTTETLRRADDGTTRFTVATISPTVTWGSRTDLSEPILVEGQWIPAVTGFVVGSVETTVINDSTLTSRVAPGTFRYNGTTGEFSFRVESPPDGFGLIRVRIRAGTVTPANAAQTQIINYGPTPSIESWEWPRNYTRSDIIDTNEEPVNGVVIPIQWNREFATTPIDPFVENEIAIRGTGDVGIEDLQFSSSYGGNRYDVLLDDFDQQQGEEGMDVTFDLEVARNAFPNSPRVAKEFYFSHDSSANTFLPGIGDLISGGRRITDRIFTIYVVSGLLGESGGVPVTTDFTIDNSAIDNVTFSIESIRPAVTPLGAGRRAQGSNNPAQNRYEVRFSSTGRGAGLLRITMTIPGRTMEATRPVTKTFYYDRPPEDITVPVWTRPLEGEYHTCDWEIGESENWDIGSLVDAETSVSFDPDYTPPSWLTLTGTTLSGTPPASRNAAGEGYAKGYLIARNTLVRGVSNGQPTNNWYLTMSLLQGRASLATLSKVKVSVIDSAIPETTRYPASEERSKCIYAQIRAEGFLPSIGQSNVDSNGMFTVPIIWSENIDADDFVISRPEGMPSEVVTYVTLSSDNPDITFTGLALARTTTDPDTTGWTLSATWNGFGSAMVTATIAEGVIPAPMDQTRSASQRAEESWSLSYLEVFTPTIGDALETDGSALDDTEDGSDYDEPIEETTMFLVPITWTADALPFAIADFMRDDIAITEQPIDVRLEFTARNALGSSDVVIILRLITS